MKKSPFVWPTQTVFLPLMAAYPQTGCHKALSLITVAATFTKRERKNVALVKFGQKNTLPVVWCLTGQTTEIGYGIYPYHEQTEIKFSDQR